MSLHPLLAPELPDDEAQATLTAAGFVNPRAARQRLQHLAADDATRQALSACLPHLLAALADAADPDHVLVSFERLMLDAPDRTALLTYLVDHPRAIEMLVTLFAGSQFLTEILLRQPDAALRLLERQDLTRRKSVEQFHAEALARTRVEGREADEIEEMDEALDRLRRYQRWELLRIGACDFLGLMDLSGVTAQLSRLAESMVRACLDLAAEQTGISADGFVVLAMGKLGGGEVNYSSDIDLLFLSRTNAQNYVRLGQRLIDALARSTTAGFLYRVDMRLRPWGRDGALVTAVDGHLDYLRKNARLWEKQALLKARPIAGDMTVGVDFLEQAQPVLFALDAETVRADVRAMKERTEAYLRQEGREWGEVKLGEGSIRDAEFVVQFLQLVHGGRNPYVRSGRTLDALSRLFGAELITADAHRTLGVGYVFLRTVEHHLQLMHYRQTSTLPTSPAELDALARRLGFSGADAGEQFVDRYQQHRNAVRSVYLHYLGSEPMDTLVSPPALPAAGLQRHLERLDPSYAAVFTESEIRHHAVLAERLNDETLVQVEAAFVDENQWRVTIVGYDYLGELSIICGLLFVYGMDIVDGEIFTYEPVTETPPETRRQVIRSRHAWSVPRPDTRQKIVDVFEVRSLAENVPADLWSRYAEDLADLVRKLHFRRRNEAHGALAHRVAAILQEREGAAPKVYPVDIAIDNDSSSRFSVLEISGPDTTGFLYELTNALALNGIYIARVEVNSVGSRVQDTLVCHGRQRPEDYRPHASARAARSHRPGQTLHPSAPEFPQPRTGPAALPRVSGPALPAAQLAGRAGLGRAPGSIGCPGALAWRQRLPVERLPAHAVRQPVPCRQQRQRAGATARRAELAATLQAEMRIAPDPEARWQVLNAFKDREMFRIDMRHILGHTAKFGQFSRELTALTEVVVEAAYRLCEVGLVAQYGLPRLEDGSPCPVAVLALGKAGGHELGFASDIELMFVYAGGGQTSGPQSITTPEFYEKLVQEFLRAIQAKREGIFEIDLQLRPYGKAGSMAVSLDAFRRYFAPGGPAWAYERQALVKLRPIAGNPDLGQQVVALRDEFVYTGEVFDVAAMRAMRERQLRHLAAADAINAKFSPGCLVDVEYLVQGLQITYGRQYPALRQTNTREAMAALAEVGILAPDDFDRLRAAHRFLRSLINALRMVRGHAKDLTVPPDGSEEFAFLARRLGYSDNPSRLRADLTQHTVVVQELSARLLDELLNDQYDPFG